MRYFRAVLACVTATVASAASCGGVITGDYGNRGGGGSTGVSVTQDSGPDTGRTCPAYKSCKDAGYNCGMAPDGCGNVQDCGTCADPTETCGGGAAPNVCGKPACNPGTCTSLGYDCGMAGDGCNGTLDCGTCPMGQVCGGTKPNVCGTTPCTPKTCAQQGFDCGMQGDGCGNPIDCGQCPAGQTCGGGGAPMPGVCGTLCNPKTCAQQGFNCGMALDGCGNIIACGTCSGGEVCGANMPNVCGMLTNCTGLCLQQTTCPGMGTTSVSGTVYAPQGVDPLPNTLVYVPNGAAGPPTWGVQPFAPGVSCGPCGADISGSPLVSAVTAVDGSFTLTDVPVGANIPLVIQNGRWRRKITIQNVPACTNTVLTAQETRMPQVQAEGDPTDNIPLMAFVTGSVDALECVLRKIGVADSQFSDPAGNGRVRFYVGAGSGGAQYSASTPPETQLWGSQAEIDKYDMVYFACQGSPFAQSAASQQIVINYANAGGRIFATHYAYAWLYDDAPFSATAAWNVDQTPSFASDPETGYINMTFPKGMMLAQWLKILYPASTLGQIPIQTLKHDLDGVIPPSLLWISLEDPNYASPVPMHYTFNTPVGVLPQNQCGRVLYEDFHVEDAVTSGQTFPGECMNPTMTQQEKMLELIIFDLGSVSCVSPPGPVCKTCAQQNTQCGPVGDGCGNILDCGSCPAGKACVAGVCTVACTPKTCADQGFVCGMQGDGCGDVIACGQCPAGQTCGGGGLELCGSGTCVPKSCAQLGYTCGYVGDGCGNAVNCGTCPQGEVCGGMTPGQCSKPPCTPKTCAQLGYNCGQASDGCGNVIACGTCSGTQICGGGGQANVCGG
jgi:hypothetical protein